MNFPQVKAAEVETAIGDLVKHAPHRRGGDKYKVITYFRMLPCFLWSVMVQTS